MPLSPSLPLREGSQAIDLGPPEKRSFSGVVDLVWLRQGVARMLARNQVEEVRTWNGSVQKAIYHAPSLCSQTRYAWPRSPGQLLPLLRLPWQVIYPHQWFWDSAAHAIILSQLDTRLAQKEIDSLLYAQRQDGFIPHLIWNQRRRHWVDWILQCLYPSAHSSPYLQPPALAEAAEAVFLRSGDRGFLERVWPRLKTYYLYLGRERSRSGDGLLEIIISYESGKDRSREYDLIYGRPNEGPVWRGPMARLMLRHRLLGWDMERIFRSNLFRVKDLLFNCVYARNLWALARLGDLVGDNTEHCRRRAQQTEASILGKMYDAETGLFYSLDARHGRDSPIKIVTISSLFPLMLDTIDEARVVGLVGHLQREFWPPYPVPVEPLGCPPGEAIWRGQQTWVYTNWFLVRGLQGQARRFPHRAEGFLDIARQITLRTYELVSQEGFREFYHSQTGRGQRAVDFGWSGLVLDMVGQVTAS